jgi:hypothetical protein
MKHGKIAGVALVGAVLSVSQIASAQNEIKSNSHGQAGVLNFGGGYGGWGFGARVDLEYQLHFNRRYEGPALGLGLTFPLWAGFGLGFEGRFMYDIQPIPNVAFFIAPYLGLSTGFWSYCYYLVGCYGAFWLGPELGLDLKIIIFDRWLIGLRPIGFSVPFFVGDRFNWGWGYHGAFLIGVTF